MTLPPLAQAVMILALIVLNGLAIVKLVEIKSAMARIDASLTSMEATMREFETDLRQIAPGP